MDFAVSADHRVKIKENEKRDKFLDLAQKNYRRLWKLGVTVTPIVIGTLGTVHKNLKRGLKALEIRGLAETIQTTALLKRDSG